MTQNKFTTNNEPTLAAISNSDGETPVYLYANPVTHAVITEGQEMVVGFDNAISTLNSTTTPLEAGATFTGTFEDLENYSGVSVLVRTDVDSAVNGAAIEWSDDGINVRRTSQTSVVGSITQGYYFFSPRQAKYFRVKYVNDGSPQTIFIAQIIKDVQAQTSSIVPVLGNLDTAVSAQVTKSVITGQSTAGGTSFVNVKVNPSGSLETNANMRFSGTDVSANNPVPITGTVNIGTADGIAQDVTLLRIGNALSRPIWYNPANNTLRVDVNSGTVTTVTSLSQMAGFDTKLTMQYPLERNLWAEAVRRNIT